MQSETPTNLQQVLLNLVLNAMDAVEGEPVERRLVSVRTRFDGGRIWAESAADKGATFRFTLPVSEQPVAEEAPAP